MPVICHTYSDGTGRTATIAGDGTGTYRVLYNWAGQQEEVEANTRARADLLAAHHMATGCRLRAAVPTATPAPATRTPA